MQHFCWKVVLHILWKGKQLTGGSKFTELTEVHSVLKSNKQTVSLDNVYRVLNKCSEYYKRENNHVK